MSSTIINESTTVNTTENEQNQTSDMTTIDTNTFDQRISTNIRENQQPEPIDDGFVSQTAWKNPSKNKGNIT